MPFRLRKAFKKIHVRLVRELEKKFSGKVKFDLFFFLSVQIISVYVFLCAVGVFILGLKFIVVLRLYVF